MGEHTPQTGILWPPRLNEHHDISAIAFAILTSFKTISAAPHRLLETTSAPFSYFAFPSRARKSPGSRFKSVHNQSSDIRAPTRHSPSSEVRHTFDTLTRFGFGGHFALRGYSIFDVPFDCHHLLPHLRPSLCAKAELSIHPLTHATRRRLSCLIAHQFSHLGNQAGERITSLALETFLPPRNQTPEQVHSQVIGIAPRTSSSIEARVGVVAPRAQRSVVRLG